ncbi:hypothetical protein J5N97_028915 [Dioscorea zingiberensis]|uniref:DUF4378 domain-containing protein n=1 Tax=Dioscorea zingiberensis TaxID=325984 RepID=A0A9D5BZW8_9LILI|nr:hypothetical protein J5N97_028915 [Dioscorea zingiberensis]
MEKQNKSSSEHCMLACDVHLHKFSNENRSEDEQFNIESNASYGKQDHLDRCDIKLARSNSMIYKALGDIAKGFLRDKFFNTKQYSGSKAVHDCKESTNIVEILDLMKESGPKLHDNPKLPLQKTEDDKLLVKAISMPGQCEESAFDDILHKQTENKFFTWKGEEKESKKSKGPNLTDELKPSKKLVVGEGIEKNTDTPSSSPHSHYSMEHQVDNRRVTFHLPVRKIISSLKHPTEESQKGKPFISMDVVLQIISSCFQDPGATIRPLGRNETVVKKSLLTFKRNTDANHDTDSSEKVRNHNKWKQKTLGYLLYEESFFSEEANNHRHENEILPTRKVFKSLGEALSLPEYKSISTKQENNSKDSEKGLLNNQLLNEVYTSDSMNSEGITETATMKENNSLNVCPPSKRYRKELKLQVPGNLIDKSRRLSYEAVHTVFEQAHDKHERNLRVFSKDLEYVRFLLEKSYISCSKLPERWISSSPQMLDPLLFSGQLVDEQKLLFDCVNEILEEIHDRHTIQSRVQKARMGANIIEEVCRGVVWHLNSQFPNTLEKLIRKDLDGKTWMNCGIFAEITVREIGDDILEVLTEESIWELLV